MEQTICPVEVFVLGPDDKEDNSGSRFEDEIDRLFDGEEEPEEREQEESK